MQISIEELQQLLAGSQSDGYGKGYKAGYSDRDGRDNNANEPWVKEKLAADYAHREAAAQALGGIKGCADVGTSAGRLERTTIYSADSQGQQNAAWVGTR